MNAKTKKKKKKKKLKELKGDFFEKMMPRLFKPLENAKYKRNVKPVLLHEDLWIGNADTEKKEEK